MRSLALNQNPSWSTAHYSKCFYRSNRRACFNPINLFKCKVFHWSHKVYAPHPEQEDDRHRVDHMTPYKFTNDCWTCPINYAVTKPKIAKQKMNRRIFLSVGVHTTTSPWPIFKRLLRNLLKLMNESRKKTSTKQWINFSQWIASQY